MTLDELKRVKQDLANGIIISRSQWVKVLEAAIESFEHIEDLEIELGEKHERLRQAGLV